MKEEYIRRKAIKQLNAGKWVVWYPYRTRFRKEKDMFGVYDLVAVKEDKTRFIQLTTLPNIRARERKVKAFLEKNNVSVVSEVWGLQKDGIFRIINI